MTAQLFAVRESALYSEVVALKTFYMNFAQNTKFLRDLVVDATTDWSKRASNSEQRLKAKYAGEVESVEKLANTIGESDQQTWELKMNDLFANKAAETHGNPSASWPFELEVMGGGVDIDIVSSTPYTNTGNSIFYFCIVTLLVSPLE